MRDVAITVDKAPEWDTDDIYELLKTDETDISRKIAFTSKQKGYGHQILPDSTREEEVDVWVGCEGKPKFPEWNNQFLLRYLSLEFKVNKDWNLFLSNRLVSAISAK